MQQIDEPAAAPAARTVADTMEHYAWTKTFIFNELGRGRLVALKAGRRTLVTTESAERLFASLPRAAYRAPREALAAEPAASIPAIRPAG
jgi:hypothetical protein